MVFDDNDALAACFKIVRVVACDPVAFRDGKVLLVKRAHDPQSGWWCLPGGLMELGEGCEQCVLRELREETGFEGRVKKLVGVYSSPSRDERQTVAVVFLVEITGGQARVSGETSEVKFFALDELPEKIAFDHRQVILDAAKLF